MSTHQVLPLPHPGRAPLAVLPVGPRDPAGPEGALDLGGSPGGLGGDAVAAAAAEESLWKRDSFFFRFFPSFRVSLLLRSLSLSLYLLSIFCTLTRCVMSFLGGTVGMPWKGKSIVGISSKTSACFFRFRVFYLFVERRFFFSLLSRLPPSSARFSFLSHLLLRRDRLARVAVPGSLAHRRGPGLGGS